MGCQYAFAVGKHEAAFSSSILVGAQYPFCKALDGRSQPVILEIFNDIAKLARKLIRDRARECRIGNDQITNRLERDQLKLTPLQGCEQTRD